MSASAELEGFLALLAARRAPRTVEAYRRDLEALEARLGHGAATATTDELERSVAEARAAGLAATTIARRVAAARSFFRHLQLLGARDEQPARRSSSCRAVRARCRGRSRPPRPSASSRLRRRRPRDLRDRALVELPTAPGLRISEALGLQRADVDLENRLLRALGKGDKERVVPMGRPAVEAVTRYLARGRPYLERRPRPELFLNAAAAPSPAREAS